MSLGFIDVDVLLGPVHVSTCVDPVGMSGVHESTFVRFSNTLPVQVFPLSPEQFLSNSLW